MNEDIMDFAKERLANVRGEIEPMLLAHYEELARNKEIYKLRPDWDKYVQFEQGGILKIYTARMYDRLVGYAAFFVQWNPHDYEMLVGANDVLYLDPECRSLGEGKRFMAYCEKQLKEIGVVKVTWHAKPDTPLDELLKRSGLQIEEHIYAKVL